MKMQTDRIKSVTEDVAYLVDELQALKYVIDAIPVHDKPPGSHSIYDMFALINHAQANYYTPIVENLIKNQTSNLKIAHFQNSFNTGESGDSPINDLLSEISRNRNRLLEILENAGWDTGCEVNGKSYSLVSLLEEMVAFERKQLREIAERVLAMESKTPEK